MPHSSTTNVKKARIPPNSSNLLTHLTTKLTMGAVRGLCSLPSPITLYAHIACLHSGSSHHTRLPNQASSVITVSTANKFCTLTMTSHINPSEQHKLPTCSVFSGPHIIVIVPCFDWHQQHRTHKKAEPTKYTIPTKKQRYSCIAYCEPGSQTSKQVRSFQFPQKKSHPSHSSCGSIDSPRQT